MKRITLLVLISLALLIFIKLKSKHGENPPVEVIRQNEPGQSNQAGSTSSVGTAVPGSSVSPEVNSAASPTKASETYVDAVPRKDARPDLNKIIPRVDQVRKEVAENPHATPQSVIRFAAELGARMEGALQSESEARDLYHDLKICVKGKLRGAVSMTSRVLCYTDAAELAEKYPSLQDSFKAIQKGLSPADLKRFESMSSLLNNH